MTSPPKGLIQDDNSKIGEMSRLLELSKLLPTNHEFSRLAENLAGVPSLPDRFNAAFVEHGWVYVEFACGYESAELALKMHSESKEQSKIDEFLAANLLNIYPIKWQAIKLLGCGMLEPANPIRAQFTERVFQAYEDEDYLVVVPLVLMLIDGFGVSETGTKSIFADLKNHDDLFQSVESIAGHPSALKSLLPHLTKGQSGYSEAELTMPLRHGILHGVRLNYSNKVVAAKVLCLLAAVVEWGRDVAPEPNSDIKRREWNANFLNDHLARLNAGTPEQALELLKSAIKERRFTDAVALIDYHPTLTLLSEKIKEWRELGEVEIKIERLSEWEVFGTGTDSEQQARCKIQLRVTSQDGVETSSDRTLFATRSAELANAGLPSVWQIGLSILGGIRNQLQS
jgi:hypothetical protein